MTSLSMWIQLMGVFQRTRVSASFSLMDRELFSVYLEPVWLAQQCACTWRNTPLQLATLACMHLTLSSHLRQLLKSCQASRSTQAVTPQLSLLKYRSFATSILI